MRYRLYLLNDAREVRRLVELEAEDDAAAYLQVLAHNERHWELLEGARLVSSDLGPAPGAPPSPPA